MLGGPELVAWRARQQRGGERYLPSFLVQAHVERTWPGLFYAPGRWPTHDGFIPWKLFLLYARALYPAWAMDRLTMASAIGLAFSGPEKQGPQVQRDAIAEAYPAVRNGKHG